MRNEGRTDVGYGIDLYWLPLGAGGHSVRLNGRVYEAVLSGLERRHACDLYHSALEIRVPEGRFVIEQAPLGAEPATTRGVVAQGQVGARWAGHLRLFRYEVRRWHNGSIPDVAEAVDSPQRVTDDVRRARRVLDMTPDVPTPVWGRDELGTGEMWNCNSVIAWLLASNGLAKDAITLPKNGRAPGWGAGLVVARRQQRSRARSVLSPMRPAGFEPATRGLQVRRSVPSTCCLGSRSVGSHSRESR